MWRESSSFGLLRQAFTGGHFAICGTPVSCLYRALIYSEGEMYRAFHQPCGCPVGRMCRVSNFPVQGL